MESIKKIVRCDGFLSKALGLRFKKRIVDSAYVFSFKKLVNVSLDMFFVHFRIDVLFLDKNKRVVEIKKGFKPYSFYRSKNRVVFVVELPAGYVMKHDVKIGSMIEF
ncbi:DUF192 domain-containing protein [Candidatus Woesearchaeota archaeon]|nr:DUF192 domain-containing protein [Candidatus Woesearchaeota archaeon]